MKILCGHAGHHKCESSRAFFSLQIRIALKRLYLIIAQPIDTGVSIRHFNIDLSMISYKFSYAELGLSIYDYTVLQTGRDI